MRLWAHETMRVLGDRLINDEDREWLMTAIITATETCFEVDFNQLYIHLDKNENAIIDNYNEFRGNLFGDILAPIGVQARPYCEIIDKDKLRDAANSLLEYYNLNSEEKLELVLFNYAIEHLLRIRRVLALPNCHLLMVGISGSGQTSLAKLASKLSDYNYVQIDEQRISSVKDFRHKLKSVIKHVGCKAEPTAFVLTEKSIYSEDFLEDINVMLNDGQMTNILSKQEKSEIEDEMRRLTVNDSHYQDCDSLKLFSLFKERCSANLNIILSLSPIGGTLRTRMRMYPSICSCTTINWFMEWPEDAIHSIAERVTSEVQLD